MAVHASIYYRDFEVDGMYQDLETGDVVDGTGDAVKAIMERSLATPLSNYDDILSIPRTPVSNVPTILETWVGHSPAQLEYAKEKWWSANFTERERIAIEVAAIRKGDNAKAVVEQMRYAKLDPSDYMGRRIHWRGMARVRNRQKPYQIQKRTPCPVDKQQVITSGESNSRSSRVGVHEVGIL